MVQVGDDWSLDLAALTTCPTLVSQRPTDEEVRDLVDRFDVNGDKELDMDEWLELCAIVFLGADDSEVLNEMFKSIGDRDSNLVTKETLGRTIKLKVPFYQDKSVDVCVAMADKMLRNLPGGTLPGDADRGITRDELTSVIRALKVNTETGRL